jgi:hypothetical protein
METLKTKILRLTKGMIVPVGSALMPLIASAASSTTPAAPITTVQGIVNLMCTAFDYMFYALIALSIIVIVIAGFNYVTANGEAEKVSKANKMILYAAVGIAVALLAKGVPLIVASFLGASKTNLSSC